MIRDIFIERNYYGQIISIGFSQTFCDNMSKHPSVLKDILKKVEIVSHTTGVQKKIKTKVDIFHETRSISLACEIADDLYKLYN